MFTCAGNGGNLALYTTSIRDYMQNRQLRTSGQCDENDLEAPYLTNAFPLMTLPSADITGKSKPGAYTWR